MRRIGLGLFIIGITFAKAYGQEDYGPVNTGAANYLTISADARSAAMGGVGVAAPGGDHAVFHNGAAALSDVTRRGGVAYTYSPWMRDYESGYSLHSLGSFYKINQRNAILLGLRYFGYPEMDGTGAECFCLIPQRRCIRANSTRPYSQRSDGYCKHCSYVLSKKSILKTPRTYFGQGIHALQTAMQNPDAHRHIPLPLQQ